MGRRLHCAFCIEHLCMGIAPVLLTALEHIAAIENKRHGGDWQEIDEAREVAKKALDAYHNTPQPQPNSIPHANTHRPRVEP
jgi:hypothetical protein